MTIKIERRIVELKETNPNFGPIQIIKTIRQEYGIGLKEAKQLYDDSLTIEEHERIWNARRTIIDAARESD
jgi:ribosomal protein L7/L12